MEMSVSVCPVPVHQLSSTPETPDLLPVIVPVTLCCAQNSLLSYWHNLFPHSLEEKSVKTIKRAQF